SAWSPRGAVLIAAAGFLAHEPGQRGDGSARIGVWIEPTTTWCAGAAPLGDQQGAAGQGGPDLPNVEAALGALLLPADQGGRLGEQRQLDRHRAPGAMFAGFGHRFVESVSEIATARPKKLG